MTLKGGSSQACAACKYQRRKCKPKCLLAPYFPPDQPEMFLNAHKLFGVSNIQKILKHLQPAQKDEAMKSIICQANIRARFPVHGCCGVIRHLYHQICLAEEELHAVHAQLALLRHGQSHLPLPDAGPAATGGLVHQQDAFVAASQVSFPNSSGGPCDSGSYVDYKDNNVTVTSFWSQQLYNNDINSNDTNIYNNSNIIGDNNYDNNGMVVQGQMVGSPAAIVKQETGPGQCYNEIHSFFDTIDDRQSYFDSKEDYNSSPESSLKDTTHSHIDQRFSMLLTAS
ncbi:hypothetical protein NMG60_11009577 [Bertholletia excelsa]